MDLNKNYESAYQKKYIQGIETFGPNPSLVEFLNLKLPVLENFPSPKRFLELGCGCGTHLSGKGEVWGVDFCETAIEKAKNDGRFCDVSFTCQDVTKLKMDEKFDQILDSHLLHCLVTNSDRQKYLENVYQHLGPTGLFYVETMVYHDQCNFGIDEVSSKINPALSNGDTPAKFFGKAENIEAEFINAGFKIVYFYIFSDKKMIPVSDRTIVLEGDPLVLRIIATRC